MTTDAFDEGWQEAIGPLRAQPDQQRLYQAQMQSWLDFAMDNFQRGQYHTSQTERFRLGDRRGRQRKRIGSPWGDSPVGENRTRHQGTAEGHRAKPSSRGINTNDLYQDCKHSHRAGTNERISVHYSDAVPEFHAMMDWLEDEGVLHRGKPTGRGHD